MNKEVEEAEYKEFIIGRSKSHQEIDTQIDRIADEFQKNENSEESYDLQGEGYRNYGGWGVILPHGGNSDHRPIPRLVGDVEDKEERPIINATERRRGASKSLEDGLDLIGVFHLGI